jgi:hypothetical protein
MSYTETVNGRKLNQRQMREWEKNRREVFGVTPPWECPGSAPSIRTNDTFMRGKKHGAFLDMTPEDQEECLAIARQAGVNPTGKFYYGQVARFKDDPLAWCGSDSDVLARARAIKVRIELNGRVYDYREKREQAKADTYEVAPDIVERYAQMQIDDNPDLSPSEQQQLTESLREDITPQWIDP